MRHAILFLSILDCSSTLRTAISMPSVTFGLVVGVFCSARTPRVGLLNNEGLMMTASLTKGQHGPNQRGWMKSRVGSSYIYTNSKSLLSGYASHAANYVRKWSSEREI